MIVDAATNQIVEAYTVGGHHWIYSDSGLVLVNQESGEVATMIRLSSLSMDFICQGLRYTHTQRLYRSVSFL